MSLLVSAIVVLILASCGDGKKANTIRPVSERINGPLGDYFEVVVKDYKVTDKGIVGIEFKRIKAGFPSPWNESMKVGYDEGYFEPLFTAEFQDEDGNALSKDKMDIVWDREELEELAALRENESATLRFDVRDEETCQVKISSTFEVHGELTFSTNVVQDDSNECDKVEVNAYVYDADGDFTNIRNSPKGTVIDKIPCGQGRFGAYLDTESNGWWHIKDSKVYDSQTGKYRDLNGDDCWIHNSIVKFEKATSGEEENSYGFDSDFSDNGSADWDKILDEYEQYVNKYYSFAEKVSKGNSSAMADALSMSEKAVSLAEKLERAEDNLSTSQANRLLKIQNKMAQAATKMAGAASKVEDMMNDIENMDVEDLLNNMPNFEW